MSADGTWNMTLNTPMGKQEGTLNLATDGGSLTGTMEQMGNSVEIANGSADGDTLKWDASITTPMPMTLNFEGKVDGDKMTGSVALGAFGNAEFEATRA